MKLPPLVKGTLLRRYKRFLADVRLEDGTEVVAHCPSPGAMTGLKDEGSVVWLSKSDNPKRKLAWTWELSEVGQGLALINSLRVNGIVEEGLRAGLLPELGHFHTLSREVRYGDSRLDFVLEGRARTYVEAKCVTLYEGEGLGAFPDAKTKRGLRHVRELSHAVTQGFGAALLFFVPHADILRVTTADDVDPDYGEAVRAAQRMGVRVVALKARVETDGVICVGPVPVEL